MKTLEKLKEFLELLEKVENPARPLHYIAMADNANLFRIRQDELYKNHIPRLIEALEWVEAEQGRLEKELEKDPHNLFSTQQIALSVVIQQLKIKLEGEK